MSVLKLGRILGVCVAGFLTHNVYGSHNELYFDFTDPDDVARFFSHFQTVVQERFVPPYPPLYFSPTWAYTHEDSERCIEPRAQPVVVPPNPKALSFEESKQSVWEKELDVFHEGGIPFFKSPSPSSLVRFLERQADKMLFEKARSKSKTPFSRVLARSMPPNVTYFIPFYLEFEESILALRVKRDCLY